MKIDMPDNDATRKLFEELDKLESLRDKAFKAVEIRNFFHKHYMKQIEIILAIAGEMQKHFKES